jgi:hypothetical protein
MFAKMYSSSNSVFTAAPPSFKYSGQAEDGSNRTTRLHRPNGFRPVPLIKNAPTPQFGRDGFSTTPLYARLRGFSILLIVFMKKFYQNTASRGHWSFLY